METNISPFYFRFMFSPIKVMHTIHWSNGDTGQYFYINEQEVEDMVGYADWSGKEFDVIQTGSRNWSGSVIIWKSGSHSAAHGRRIEESATKQWAAGDIIRMQICESKHINYNWLVAQFKW